METYSCGLRTVCLINNGDFTFMWKVVRNQEVLLYFSLIRSQVLIGSKNHGIKVVETVSMGPNTLADFY